MFIVIIRSTTFHILGVIKRLHDYTCMATCQCGYLILWLRGPAIPDFVGTWLLTVFQC